MNKREIRQIVLDKLKSMPFNERVQRSKEASKDLLKALKDYSTISIFESFDWEIDTKEVIKQLLDSGKRIAIPKVVSKEEMIMVDKLTGEEVSKNEIEAIVVPCVAHWHNYRIGYGRGYYDRYLSTFGGNTILYAFKEQEHKFTPDTFDWPIKSKIVR